MSIYRLSPKTILEISLFFFLSTGFLSNAETISAPENPRIIVTTDITNEPDDQQSLVRLLVYSNNYDIEGLIGSTGIWKLTDPATDVIHECIDAYAKVRKNLVLHDPDFPTAEYLHSVTTTGNRYYGMSAIGHRGMSSEGHRGSPGANLIIEVVDRDDPRPVWLLAWGGTNTIAQALWTVEHTRTREELETFISKMRIYDLAGQDDAGAWMANRFPCLFIIRNVLAYKGMSIRFSSDANQEAQGGDETVVTREWVKENIQRGHGALGKKYIDALHIWEGDTPTYFHVMPNGLNDPEQPWQGGWGGLFSREKQKNVNVVAQEYAGAPCWRGGCWVNEEPYLDYWMYADADDTWEYDGTSYDNRWSSIFRWRRDFQNDFAARIDWCVKSYDEANHNPIAVVNGDKTRNVLYLDAKVGSLVELSSAGSSDPDGDELCYDWWVYERAGTYEGEVEIENSSSDSVSVEIPSDAVGKTIHVVLTLRDSGTPQLTSYRRIIMKGVHQTKTTGGPVNSERRILKAAGLQMNVSTDIELNKNAIILGLERAAEKGAELLVTPEGALSGYHNRFDHDKLKLALEEVEEAVKASGIALLLGTCINDRVDDKEVYYNQVRAYAESGELLGEHSKILRCSPLDKPGTGEMLDYREGELNVIQWKGIKIGILICNDLWATPGFTTIPNPYLPLKLKELGADVIFHSINTGSNQRSRKFHEASVELWAYSLELPIFGVNAAKEAVTLNAPSGLVNSKGERVVYVPLIGEQLFYCDIEIH